MTDVELRDIHLGDGEGDTSTITEPATPPAAPQEDEGPDAVGEQLLQQAERHAAARLEYLDQRASEMAKIEVAEPLFGQYPYWDLYSAGPFQGPFNIVTGPVRPHKVVAVGELVRFYLLIWTNPNPANGGVSGSMYLGGLNNFTIRWETVNLTDVTNGPSRIEQSQFSPNQAPASQFTLRRWQFRPRTPGLYDFHVTVDFTAAGHPVAGFATWNYDPDRIPATSVRPPVPPQWQHDIPVRFLVYRK